MTRIQFPPNLLDAGVVFLVAVEDSLEQLSRFPLLGKTSLFQNKQFQNIRMWKVKDYENYLVFYAVSDDTIEVIRDLHSSRNIEELFG